MSVQEITKSLELPQQAATLLASLTAQYKMSAIDIAQRGIAIMAIALKAQKQGFGLAVVSDDGEIVARITNITDDALTAAASAQLDQAAHQINSAVHAAPMRPAFITNSQSTGSIRYLDTPDSGADKAGNDPSPADSTTTSD